MPTLKETEFVGEVVWLGMCPAGGASLRSEMAPALERGFGGLPGARHEGETRASCVRVRALYGRGTEIRNVRQLTILSEEELAVIAGRLGLGSLDPALAGANMVLRGIPDLTHVPPSSRLQAPTGATLTVDMENLPCIYPAREIEADERGHGEDFPKAAYGLRGVTAWVERPGAVAVGDRVRLFVPAQRGWAP